MVDGINELSGFLLPAINGRHGRGSRYRRVVQDSRECPGPSSEATLHRPSPRRVLTAGAIALAAVAPAIDPSESQSDSARALPPLTPARVESVALDAHAAFVARSAGSLRASRSATRRIVSTHPAVARIFRPAILAAVRSVNLAVTGVARETGLTRPSRAAEEHTVASAATHTGSADHAQSAGHAQRAGHTRSAARAAASRVSARATPARRTNLARRAVHFARPVVRLRHTYRAVVTRHFAAAHATRRVSLRGGMSAVIAYARSQVGRSYVTGGEGRSGFDCSGLTKLAYARAGIRLPHSSRAQAARAHTISRRVARPGDLVIGRGHVGIYMGHGMMIDAGNHRTGVVYRKLYSGLRVGRL
jgi:cell wall-associated NlpC family hydrolase